MAALERQRLADDYVLNRAEDRASTDPVLAMILADPNTSQRMKVRAAYNRLSQIPEFAENDPGVGTIIAASEGGVISPDAGAFAGLARQRRSNRSIGPAIRHASMKSAVSPRNRVR